TDRRFSGLRLIECEVFHGSLASLLCEGGEDPFRGEWGFGDADAQGVVHGVGYGGVGGNGRRLADADDAALRHVHHVYDDLRHVLDAAQLVELHVRVDLPPRGAVHDALLEQRVVHAHDDAAGHLRLAALQVDNHAAVLHGHD